MATQRPTDEKPQALALPNTQAAMLVRVKDSIATGLLAADSFSSNLSQAQQSVLAKVALAYQLDPLMGELAVLHGKPYPTIKAKRRKHAEAGHQPSITFRDLHDWEKTLYKQAGDLKDTDLALVCVMTREDKSVVEHFAKVTREERDRRATDPNKFASPVVRDNPIEMVQKRGEAGAWEKAYGPLGLPKVFEEMLMEPYTEEEMVEGQIISDIQIPWCDTHDIQFKRNVSEKDGHVWYSHRDQKSTTGWHNATQDQNDLFEGITPATQAAPPDAPAGPPQASDDGDQSPADSDPLFDEGDQSPAAGAPPTAAGDPLPEVAAPTEMTNKDVFDLAKALGYGPARIPTILGTKEARITLPQWIASNKTYAEAMTRIRKYHQMDKGGRPDA